MPTNRTRVRRGLVGGRLNDRQRSVLLIGPIGDRFGKPGEPGFTDDAEAAGAWWAHREALIGDRSFNTGDAGARPHGFWAFEAGLKRDNFGWKWPHRCRSEQEVVYRFHADDAEQRAIEESWRCCPASAPKWFRRKHLKDAA